MKPIHHPTGSRRRFRELVLAYHDTVKSETRLKKKLKAKFRQNGSACQGETVYRKKHRAAWRQKLPQDQVVQKIVAGLWRQLDETQGTTKELGHLLRHSRRAYPELKRFQAVPGIGLIHAATISALLETPYRFATKKKGWMYAGLGLVERTSGGKRHAKKLTKDYHRLLKYTLKQAAASAIAAQENPFRHHYLHMTLQEGIPPPRAK